MNTNVINAFCVPCSMNLVPFAPIHDVFHWFSGFITLIIFDKYTKNLRKQIICLRNYVCKVCSCQSQRRTYFSLEPQNHRTFPIYEYEWTYCHAPPKSIRPSKFESAAESLSLTNQFNLCKSTVLLSTTAM